MQVTTDGHRAYLEAVEGAFGMDCDYAMLQKIYGAPSESEARRYSPARCIGSDMKVISGDPDPKHVSTSYVERQNLTMRMSMRRFTRLTNGFSKKLENHCHMVALHYMYYNFCRVHQSLRVTPAMEAGICDHVWDVEELIVLLPEPQPKKRGPSRSDSHRSCRDSRRACVFTYLTLGLSREISPRPRQSSLRPPTRRRSQGTYSHQGHM